MLSHDEMEAGTYLFLSIVTSSQVKQIIVKEKKVFKSVDDWMEANLNASLQLVVRKGLGLSRLNGRKNLAYVLHFIRKILIKNYEVKKRNVCMDELFTI